MNKKRIEDGRPFVSLTELEVEETGDERGSS